MQVAHCTITGSHKLGQGASVSDDLAQGQVVISGVCSECWHVFVQQVWKPTTGRALGTERAMQFHPTATHEDLFKYTTGVCYREEWSQLRKIRRDFACHSPYSCIFLHLGAHRRAAAFHPEPEQGNLSDGFPDSSQRIGGFQRSEGDLGSSDLGVRVQDEVIRVIR